MVQVRATHHVQQTGISIQITMTKSLKRKASLMTDKEWKAYIDHWIQRSIHLKKLNEELEEDKCKQNSANHVEEKDLKRGSS